MKLVKMLVVIAAATTFSCVPDVISVQIQHALPGPDESCVVQDSETDQKVAGLVDVGYLSPQVPAYYLGLRIISALESEGIQASGTDVNPGSRNDFYIKEIVLDYEGKGIPAMEKAVPMSGRLPAGGVLFGGFNILTKEAYDRLIQIASNEGFDVTVNIRLRGTFANGSDYETEPFSFPLTVVASEAFPPVCELTTHEPVSLSGTNPPCGNWGQDGVIYACACRENCGDTCGGTQVCNMATCACEEAAPQ